MARLRWAALGVCGVALVAGISVWLLRPYRQCALYVYTGGRGDQAHYLVEHKRWAWLAGPEERVVHLDYDAVSDVASLAEARIVCWGAVRIADRGVSEILILPGHGACDVCRVTPPAEVAGVSKRARAN